VYSFPFNTNSIARIDKNGNLREFKLILEGSTVVHGYEEITDSEELRERLIAQGGDTNNSELEELLKEMNYGAPPATSFGLSIDRLTMLLSGAKSIKEVITFPFSRLRKK
jgi:lysyl-tRNA synthetase class 2